MSRLANDKRPIKAKRVYNKTNKITKTRRKLIRWLINS